MKSNAWIRLAVVLTALAFCLGGCASSSSSYRALLLVRSNTAASAWMEFHEFEGRMVFKLQGEGRSGWYIRCTARLESGSAGIFYMDGDQKKIKVCTVAAGDETEAVLGGFDLSSVTIIVETSETCQNGSFHFDRE